MAAASGCCHLLCQAPRPICPRSPAECRQLQHAKALPPICQGPSRAAGAAAGCAKAYLEQAGVRVEAVHGQAVRRCKSFGQGAREGARWGTGRELAASALPADAPRWEAWWGRIGYLTAQHQQNEPSLTSGVNGVPPAQVQVSKGDR